MRDVSTLQFPCSQDKNESDRAWSSGELISLVDVIVIAHLNTQRNAIKMLHDRMLVLLEYIKAIQGQSRGNPNSSGWRFPNAFVPMAPADPTTKQDHQVTREIMALVSCLPVMSEKEFKMELLTVSTPFSSLCDVSANRADMFICLAYVCDWIRLGSTWLARISAGV